MQLVFLLRFAAAAAALHQPRLRAAEGGVGWVLVTAAFYVLNGVSDVAGDRANGSTRPLASGLLSVRGAVAGLILLGLLGVAACFGAGLMCGELACVLAVLGVCYSIGPRLKENAFAAALTIGGGAGLTYVAGWSLNGAPSAAHVEFAGVLSFWIAVACATKDFSDVEGDRLAGRHTVATMLGVKGASHLVSLLSAGASGALLLTSWLAHFEIVPALLVVLGSWVLPSAGSRAARSTGRRPKRSAYRVYMATQYAANGSMIVLGSAA
ncbi:homogentisate phytyltransferase [Nocardioides baekrokdamisoli]|uniref:Homogentisate phytyltransferase n=1 Tax=Nocardioides baekrokdamisoli TaxID=1804624 RepID=A0A3G9IYL6_9ACTN|nr:UbiA family prenyltransferase [Nocardioides baekrokdamisoli]BBH15759.1 homogentisate phytyltransferase [Nocardioides baekrokdamisoli]